MFGVCFVMVSSVYAPIFYSWYSVGSRPITDLEKKEAKIINNAIDKRFGDSWKRHIIFRAREE